MRADECLRSLDLIFINQFAHRSPTFDQSVVLLSTSNFLKGSLVFAALWWLWFQDGDNRRMAAGFVGLAVARVLAFTVIRAGRQTFLNS
jgi:hypothetical protein